MTEVEVTEFLSWIPWTRFHQSEKEVLIEKLQARPLTLELCKDAVLAYISQNESKKYPSVAQIVAICWKHVKARERNAKPDAADYDDLPVNFRQICNDWKSGTINAVAHDDGRFYGIYAQAVHPKRLRYCLTVARVEGGQLVGDKVNLWGDEFGEGWQGVFDESEPHTPIEAFNESIRGQVQSEREKHTRLRVQNGSSEESPW